VRIRPEFRLICSSYNVDETSKNVGIETKHVPVGAANGKKKKQSRIKNCHVQLQI
jgi:hypothetical protein